MPGIISAYVPQVARGLQVEFRNVWVPKTSSGPIDLDFCCRDTDDEDGAWHSPSSTLPSSVRSNWFGSRGVSNRTSPSKSSCFATRLRSCAPGPTVPRCCVRYLEELRGGPAKSSRARQPAKGRAGLLGGEGQGTLGLEVVDEQVAGAQPQGVVRCRLTAPAPLAHFTTARARQPGTHSETDALICRARRHEPVCVGCRTARSARPRRTPH